MPDELARVDGLLDDPVFFAPFVPFFDPRIGRPSTPMETYLRLMFLKFRYRLGYESLCREVSDSITWRRFCRIPLDGSVPHPTTLMKLTTRCGSAAVDGLNEALLAKAAEAKLLRTSRVRADTTVVPANVCLPDRLRAAGQGGPPDRRDRAADPGRGRCGPHQGAGPVPRGREAGARRSPRSCGPARSWAATRPRPGCSGSPGSWPIWPSDRRGDARDGCWSTPGGRCAGPGPRRPSWPRPAVRDAAAGRRRGRLARAVNDLTELLEATRQIVGADPAADRRDHPGRGDPAGQPARRAMPGRSPRAGSGKPVEFGYKAQVVDNDDGIVLDHNVRAGQPARRAATGPGGRAGHRPRPGAHPRTVTADRGYGEAAVDDAAAPTSASAHVVIPRKGRPGKARQADEHRRAFRRTVKWRTGCEGRISTLKRGYGWDRTRIDGLEGARIWTGHGVFAHNLIKIAALAA